MITIIGGGAIGLSTAYFLHKAGHPVQVLERDAPQDVSGCSYGNAGMVVPSHFVPLAAPGVVRQGLKWMLDRRSPLYIKPRLDADLLRWLWLFFRSANQKNVLRAGDQLFRLNQASRELYTQIIETEGFDMAYERRGLMMLYQTPQMEAEEQHLAREAQQLGIKTTVLDAQEVQALESDFVMKVRGGVHYHSDAHLDPGVFMGQLRNFLLDAGVPFYFGAEVQDFRLAGRRLTHVLTNRGDFATDQVVLAMGAWSPALSRKLGITIPLQGGKGYSLTIQNAPRQLNIPSILCERKIAVTPMGQHLRVAGTMEIAGTNRAVSEARLQGIKAGVGEYLGNFDPTWVEGLDPWIGLRPLSPDGLPYIGPCAAW
ncbi:MAG TPA: amino acid dehydrogenase, partial [Cytophagales bacterium]|nr:amino acid dehydrogenase [Cytophagales bacterium]